MMTLEYPMVAISLTRAQWDEVMKPLLQAVLPRIGIAVSFPRLVVYAPLSRNGLGLIHPYDNQHLKQLQTALRHGDRSSPTGQLIRASYEQMQLEIGTDVSFLSLPFSEYGNLATHCWIGRLWQYLSENNITLHPGASQAQMQYAQKEWTLEPKHEGLSLGTKSDRFLMHLFIDAGYKNNKLLALNVCRMYLHAVTLSDIATADGIYVTQSAWTGQRDHDRKSPYYWPRTYRPGNGTWQLWQEALTKTAIVRQATDLHIRFSLGHWISNRANWQWLVDKSKTCLYHKEGHRWRIFKPRTTRNAQHRRYHSGKLIGKLPKALLRATVDRVSHDKVTLSGIGREALSNEPIATPTTFSEAIKNHQKTSEGWCLEIVQGRLSDHTYLINAFNNNRLFIVTTVIK